MRIVIPSATSMLLGMQLIYSAFFLTLLGISASTRDNPPAAARTGPADDPSPRLPAAADRSQEMPKPARAGVD